ARAPPLPGRHAAPPLDPRAAVGHVPPRERAASLCQALLDLISEQREHAPVGDAAIRRPPATPKAATTRQTAIRFHRAVSCGGRGGHDDPLHRTALLE